MTRTRTAPDVAAELTGELLALAGVVLRPEPRGEERARWRAERAAIRRRYEAGETVRELAEALGVTPQAVRLRLRAEGVDLSARARPRRRR